MGVTRCWRMESSKDSALSVRASRERLRLEPGSGAGQVTAADKILCCRDVARKFNLRTERRGSQVVSPNSAAVSALFVAVDSGSTERDESAALTQTIEADHDLFGRARAARGESAKDEAGQ